LLTERNLVRVAIIGKAIQCADGNAQGYRLAAVARSGLARYPGSVSISR
jgi:hypothetical protein